MSYKDWIKCKISDLGDIVSGGTPSTKIVDNWDGDISWITPKDLSGFYNRFISTGERKISDKGLANSSAKLMPKGSVLFSSRAPIGYVAIASKELSTNQGFKCIVPNGNNYNIFIYYLLKYITDEIKSIAGGSTFSEISGTAFKNVDITIPKLNEQKAIANILSSLDDKIELNQKINKNLEELAQTLYKRWFVNFEFPNEEGLPYKSSGGEMVESELGLIPKGWNVRTLGQKLKTVLGGTPSRNKKEYWGKGYFWLNSGALNEPRIIEATEEITQLGLDNSATKLMPKGTILIGITGYVGLISMLEIEACGNQSIVGVLPSNELPRSFVYGLIKSNIKEIASNQTGSAQQHINKNDINSHRFILPAPDTIIAFDKIIENIHQQISNNLFQNIKLIKLRDLLLPKLMSGEIEIPVGDNHGA